MFFGVLPYKSESQAAMYDFYRNNNGGNGYSQELANLKAERENVLQMYNEEAAKKKSSEESLLEYKQKIAELDEQIVNFAEDLTNELWGIDFKGWADQISDALWTAFENGEDAVKAFRETANDIIADVAKRMMTLSVIEPMFQRLQKALFGEWDAKTLSYTGGAIQYDSNGNIDMQRSEQPVLKVLGQYFGEGGEMEKSVEASEMFYDWVKKITGIDFANDDDSSSSMSNTIKGITEQTADLLASYVNAIRADVSVIRELDGKAVMDYWPSQIRLMTSGTDSLRNIEQYTAAIMRSNDTIASNVAEMQSDIRGLKNKAWKMPIA
jgi:hypothetical protein